MQNNKINNNQQELKIQNSVEPFFKRFEVNKIPYESQIQKISGFTVSKIISIMMLPFLHKNFKHTPKIYYFQKKN